MLWPLEVLEQPWKDLSLDFIVRLPESIWFNTV
jgi:hypothetical protein